MPLAVAPSILALAIAPAMPIFADPAIAWTAGCCGYGLAKGLPRMNLCAVMAGPAAMIMHAAWSFGFWSQLLRYGARLDRRPPVAAASKVTEGARPGIAA
jgi:succinoglycan biosynthesis protein ExoA